MSTISELKDSCKKNFEEKISSPFYGAFIISWLIWNWKVWYVTFFIDSELLMKSQNILKIDYISNFYPWNSFWHVVGSLGHIFVFPVISSYLIIFWLTKITKVFFMKYLDCEYENNLYKIKKDKQLLDIKQTKLETEEKVLEKEEKVGKIKIKTQEEVWEKEYEDFKNSKYFNNFPTIRESIYVHGGYTYWNNYRMPSSVVAYFHANNIVEGISEQGNKLRLTEKGKYFIKKYSEEN